jgi:excisionase family DNA binding protein
LRDLAAVAAKVAWMSTAEIEPLRSVAEVARALRVSTVTIYRAVGRGELEAVRIGASGPLRISEAALEHFLRPAVKP